MLTIAAPGVVIVRAERRFIATHTSLVTARLSETAGTLHLFIDFSALLSYESASRTLATDWCAENRDRLAALHIVSKPGLVAMGAATAAMTLSLLGLRTESYSDEALFAEAVKAAETASRHS
jgi:hypothetical protein